MRVSAALSVVLLLVVSAAAQDEHHHASGEKLGDVHFATSCSPAAQPEFDRAVALLHSFEFSRAVAGFRSALKADETCGIAYWGIALSQWSNPFASGLKDRAFLDAGRATLESAKAHPPKTERERGYLDAVAKLYENFESVPQQQRLFAYRDAMAKLSADNPTDPEAKIFYALALAESEPADDKSYSQRIKAGEILEKLFVAEPNHPGLAHYIIHTYDVPALAAKAVAAARKYAAIAPDSPHAHHMPSHTFTRLGYWQESVETNVRSAQVARREKQTSEELHASDYQTYAYLQMGQDAAAKRLVDSLPEIEKRFDPKVLMAGAAPPQAGYFALAAIPARYALERGDWKQAASLQPRTSPFAYTDAMVWFAKGIGAARAKDAELAQKCSAELEALRKKLEAAHDNYWTAQVEIQRRLVDAWAEFAAGKDKSGALTALKQAAELEDKTEKSAISPGPLMPARELLGEMLLEMNRPGDALKEFEAVLTKEPDRFRSVYGAAKAAKLAGQKAQSRKYYALLLKVAEKAEQPLRPELAEARAAVSKKS